MKFWMTLARQVAIRAISPISLLAQRNPSIVVSRLYYARARRRAWWCRPRPSGVPHDPGRVRASKTAANRSPLTNESGTLDIDGYSQASPLVLQSLEWLTVHVVVGTPEKAQHRRRDVDDAGRRVDKTAGLKTASF